MKTRYKLLILLLIATVAVGALVLLRSGDDEGAVYRFRWLVFNHPTRMVSETANSLADLTSNDGSFSGLWYGGMSLVAIIMMGLVLKAVSNAEVRAFREKLVAMEVAKAEVEELLQDAIWNEKHARAAREAAVGDLEGTVARSIVLENQLSEKEKLLRTRDSELKTLRAQINMTKDRPAPAEWMKEPADGELREELTKKTQALEAKQSAIAELERNLNGRLHALENQLNVKSKLLRERDKELEALRVQVTEAGTAKNQAESLLAEELKREKQAFQAKDTALKQLERNLTEKLHTLEVQLADKDVLLQGRSKETEALAAEVNSLTKRLADAASGKGRTETLLQKELQKNAELLKSKEAAFKQLETRLDATVKKLENQLGAKEDLLQVRNKDLQTLHSELKTMTGRLAGLETAKGRAESTLEREIKKSTEVLRDKENALKALQESLTATVDGLEARLVEKDKLLEERDSEMARLSSELNTLASVGSAKKRAETVLQQELKKQMEALQAKDAAVKQLERNLTSRLHALEAQLTEKENHIRGRDAELESLRSQVNTLADANSSKEQAESLLAEELRKEKQALRAKESAMKDLEQTLTAKLRALEDQLDDKQKALQGRSTEMEALTAEVQSLTGRVADLASGNEQLEHALEQELKQKTELLQAKDIAFGKLETSLSRKVDDLENQLSAKEAFLKQRDTELDALMAQLGKMGSAKTEIEELLRAELGKTTEVLEAKDSTIQALEESLRTTSETLERQIKEQERGLDSRAAEVEALRTEVHHLKTQLADNTAAMERPEQSVREASAGESASTVEALEEHSKRIQALESQLREKQDLLKTGDAKIQRLEAELKEKRTELARHEITVWQGIERRNLWKQRLGKFGIRTKD